MRKRQLVLGGLVLMVLIGSSGSAFPSPEAQVVLSDDAYQYCTFADGQHDQNYIEWWYFNLFDAVQDIQIIFAYSIVDPEDYSGDGEAIVGAVGFVPQGTINESDSFSTDRFSASYAQADVRIEGSAIEVIDEDTYRIVGSLGNGRLSWDLIYVRQADSWFGGDCEQVGLFPWEQMSWLVYMPGAYVSGEIELEGRSYSVDNAPGYHDHNWGEWIPCTALWNWAQYFEPGLAFEMGDFMRKSVGTMSIEFEGKRTVFSKDQYRLIHTQWGFDRENSRFFPMKSWLYAENNKRRLLLSMEAHDTEAVQRELPFPLPDVVIYEQTARYVGRLWEERARGRWELLVSFRGDGFKEYTTRKWKTTDQISGANLQPLTCNLQHISASNL